MNPFQNPCPAVSAQVQVFQPHKIPLRFRPSITAVTSVMPEKIGLCGDTDADSVPFELLRTCPCSRVLRLAGLIAVSDRTKKRLFRHSSTGVLPLNCISHQSTHPMPPDDW